MLARFFLRNTEKFFALNGRAYATQAMFSSTANASDAANTAPPRQPRREYNNRENRRDNNYKPRNRDTQQQVTEEQDIDDKPVFKQLSFEEYLQAHSSTKVGHFSEVKFPYNFKGMKDFVPIKKDFDSMIFGRDEDADFLEEFDNIMVDFMKSISTSHSSETLPIGEVNFLLKAKAGAETLRRNGFDVKFVEDAEGFASTGLKKGGQPFELTHILGLSSDRTRNSGTEGYKIIRDFEESGLIIFINTQLKQNDDGMYDIKQTREDDKQMILRVHYKYATPYVLQVTDSNGKVISPAPESYIHTAVFENQLRLPPKFSRLDLHFLDWIKLFRVQQAWRIVDFDRFLEGNRLIFSEADASKLYKMQQL